MSTRDVFSGEELAALRGFPEISREELIRCFTLTPGLPLAAVFGSGTLSSSDGQRFPTQGKSLTARALSRYFADQGLSSSPTSHRRTVTTSAWSAPSPSTSTLSWPISIRPGIGRCTSQR